jgi:hypothetical protein
MGESEKSLCERYSRVEQKLRDLARKRLTSAELTGRVSGTSEETAGLFSAGTTPAVKVTMNGP